LTKEDYEVLRDYLDSSVADDDGNYTVKLTRVELEGLISAIDEVVAF
jgi:hypothetical protein